jgi:cell division ATPase FtsA
MVQFFLPKIKPNTATFERPKIGDINRRKKGTLEELQKAIDVDKTTGHSVCEYSIPDIWARVLLFEMALYEPTHPLHDRIMNEWKGFLAVLALRDLNLDIANRLNTYPLNFDQLKKSDKEGFGDTSGFLRILFDSRPEGSIDKNFEWDKHTIYIITLMDDKGNGGKEEKVIGITSPTTLVCTSVDYSDLNADRLGIKWYQNGIFINPVGKINNIKILNDDQEEGLRLWLDGLINDYDNNYIKKGNFHKNYAKKASQLLRFLKEYSKTLGGLEIHDGKFKNGKSLGMGKGIFNIIDTPKTLAYGTNSDVKLKKSTGKENIDNELIVLVDPVKYGNGVDPGKIIIFDNITCQACSIDPNAVSRDRKKIFNKNLPENWKIFKEEDFFTDKIGIFVEKDIENFPNVLPANYGSGDEGYGYYGSIIPILPINPELLNFLSAECIANNTTIYCNRGSTEIEVRLKLELLKNNQTVDCEVSHVFKASEGKVVPIKEDLIPQITVWPNIKVGEDGNDWKHYYSYCAVRKKFYGIPDNFPDRSIKIMDGKFGIFPTESFPEAIIMKEINEDLGILPLMQPGPEEYIVLEDNDWNIGIDFGSTNTTVFVNDGTIKPLKFDNNLFYVIKDDFFKLRSFKEFLPPTNTPKEKDTFLSYYWRNDLAAKNKKIKKEIIKDGHIYYVSFDAGYTNFDVDEKRIIKNLKWGTREERECESLFLEQIFLQCCVEACKNRVNRINWRYSFPTSFSRDYRKEYISLWNNYNNSYSETTGLRFNSMEKMSESVASARYFFIENQLSWTGVSLAIDIGGGTTDVSIWESTQERPELQYSIRLAAREILLDALYNNERVAEELFPFSKNKEDSQLEEEEIKNKKIIELIKNRKQGITYKDKQKFYSIIETIFSKNINSIIDQMLFLKTQPGFPEFKRNLKFAIAGLFYYIGITLRKIKEKTKDKKITACVGGNGSRMFNLIETGVIDNSSDISKLCVRVIDEALNEDSDSKNRYEFVLSEQPKKEAAYGLVASNVKFSDKKDNRDYHTESEAWKSQMVIGEDLVDEGGKRYSYDKEVKPNIYLKKPLMIDNLNRFEKFINIFDEYAIDNKIKPVEDEFNKNKQDIKDHVNNTLAKYLRDRLNGAAYDDTNIDDLIDFEPPFIIALRYFLIYLNTKK